MQKTTSLAACYTVAPTQTSAMVLYRLVYWWRKRNKQKYSYIRRSRAELMNETGLSFDQVKRALARLDRAGLIERKQALYKNRAVLHVRLTSSCILRINKNLMGGHTDVSSETIMVQVEDSESGPLPLPEEEQAGYTSLPQGGESLTTEPSETGKSTSPPAYTSASTPSPKGAYKPLSGGAPTPPQGGALKPPQGGAGEHYSSNNTEKDNTEKDNTLGASRQGEDSSEGIGEELEESLEAKAKSATSEVVTSTVCAPSPVSSGVSGKAQTQNRTSKKLGARAHTKELFYPCKDKDGVSGSSDQAYKEGFVSTSKTGCKGRSIDDVVAATMQGKAVSKKASGGVDWELTWKRWYPGYVGKVTGETRGKLRDFEKTCGDPETAAKVFEALMSNWKAFTNHVKAATGSYKAPDMPNPGYICVHANAAVDFWKEMAATSGGHATKKGGKAAKKVPF